MGLILLFIAITLFIGIWTWIYHLDDYKKSDRRAATTVGFTVPAIIFTIIACLVLAASFENYSVLRAQYDATVNQYRSAITMYTDRADLNVKKAAFTDFVYKGYQDNISGFIKSLRKEVVIYNKTLIKKRVYVKNWFFSWIIVAPDSDMKIINMIEK